VLVGDDGVMVARHGRVLAARKLGLSEVPVIVLSHLTPTRRRAQYGVEYDPSWRNEAGLSTTERTGAVTPKI
jgi:hypothetical protein